MDLGRNRRKTKIKSLRRTRLAGLAVTLSALLLCLAGASPSAAAPPLTGDFCQLGSAAGECLVPKGVATNAVSGDIYLVDEENRRIDQFSAWGAFVRAWGWGVRTGAAELQTCTAETACRKGLAGSGAGQFWDPVAIAVDSAGNVYVTDPGEYPIGPTNYRVQKFDSEGHFLLMFGGEVDKGPNHPGNVCAAAFIAEGDVCGAGTSGTGNGEFGPEWRFEANFSAMGIAIGPADEVYVGDENRIQVFDAAGAYQRQLLLPQPGVVRALAVDQETGNLYMAYQGGTPSPNVYRLDQNTGAVLDTLEVARPSALAVDGSGQVYVFDNRLNGGAEKHSSRVLVFNAAGTLVETFAEVELFSGEEILSTSGLAVGEACFEENSGERDIYLSEGEFFGERNSALYAFGPTPDPAVCPPPQVPPSIDGQFAVSVSTSSAVLKAEINPHYFTEEIGTTTFYVQYGSAACVESEGWASGCVSSLPVPPASLKAVPADKDVTTTGVVLGGLSSDTEYRYRFVAEGTGAPGEPVIGLGGKPGIEGASTALTTPPLPTSPAPCQNDGFRSGAGASLPDCRAYEMVSPLDKAGGDAQARPNAVPFEARMDQAAVSGDALTFSAYRPFQEPKAAPYSSQYLSRRDPVTGWGTEFISPPQEGEAFINQLYQIDNLYRAFSEDLGFSWLQTDTEPVLGAGGLAGHPNIYRRQSASATYAACTSVVPQLSELATQAPQLQGFSRDGHLAVFRMENKLTPDASSVLRDNGSPIYQLYACSYDGGTATVRLVSALPNGTASTLENTAGGPANAEFQNDQGRAESLENAVSSDGRKAFWTAAVGADGSEPGALYVRLNPGAEPTGGACVASEPEKACTQQISAGPARFWTAAEDGSIAIFSTAGGQLNEYEVATKKTRPFAVEALGVLGASADAKRVYFVSKAPLAAGATPGEPNLFLHDAGPKTTAFIATLGEEDLAQNNEFPGAIDPEPAFHTARVTPDGSVAVFMSASPRLAEDTAEYDNTDQGSGKPAAEIYRYALGEGLSCISCNRTGVRPQGREIQNQVVPHSPQRIGAAFLPPWLNSLYAPRVLSENGNRIFFEAFESLTSADTNGKADVYEWEQLGTGNCLESDSAYDPANGGCLGLISSGEGTTDSQFVDASPDGRDVFIRTASPLVSWDPGQIDIYDARVLGGFPAPPSATAECEGEACQGAAGQPEQATPASAAYRGVGNLRSSSAGRRCPKGRRKVQRKGRARCVKAHKHRRHAKRHRRRHAQQTRRAGR